MKYKSFVIEFLLPNAKYQTFPRTYLGTPSIHISRTRFVLLTCSQFGIISVSHALICIFSRYSARSSSRRLSSCSLSRSLFLANQSFRLSSTRRWCCASSCWLFGGKFGGRKDMGLRP